MGLQKFLLVWGRCWRRWSTSGFGADEVGPSEQSTPRIQVGRDLDVGRKRRCRSEEEASSTGLEGCFGALAPFRRAE